jgi:lysophospholipase L1-like esterase
LGTNDLREDPDFTSTSQFSENITKIIEIFRTFKTRSGKTPLCLIATIPPIPKNFTFPFTEASMRRVRKEINPAIKQIASAKKLVLVDNYTLFVDQPQLLPDIHPSNEGYRQIAKNWYDSLQPFLK